MLPGFGVCDELCVTDARIVAGGIDAQPVLARTKLNLRHALAPQPLVRKQERRR